MIHGDDSDLVDDKDGDIDDDDDDDYVIAYIFHHYFIITSSLPLLNRRIHYP
jgi:hypothetical protein